MSSESAREQIVRLSSQLVSRWRGWLRARHGALASRHDDILQEAAADLVAYTSRDQGASHSDEDLARIGFTILKRRVADEFRSIAAASKTDDISEKSDDIYVADSDPAETLHYARLLRAVIGIIGTLDKPSRDLLLRGEIPDAGSDESLSEAERQRLSRLRAELRRRLLDDHRIDIRQLLRN